MWCGTLAAQGIWCQFVQGARFNLVWWACTFPMTAFAIATSVYAVGLDHWFPRTLNFFTVLISTTAVLVVAGRTAYVLARRGAASLLPDPPTDVPLGLPGPAAAPAAVPAAGKAPAAAAGLEMHPRGGAPGRQPRHDGAADITDTFDSISYD